MKPTDIFLCPAQQGVFVWDREEKCVVFIDQARKRTPATDLDIVVRVNKSGNFQAVRHARTNRRAW